MERKYKLIPILGLSFVFLFFGIDKFIHPLLWISWQPTFFDGLLGFAKEGWNIIFAVIEFIFVILLLIPRTRWIGAGLMTVFVAPIVIMTWPSDIAVRDIGLMSISLYLFLSFLPQKKSN